MKITESTLDRRVDMLLEPDAEASVADRIRYLITRMRKTQAEFGRLIDVDPSNMSKLMNGHIRITDRTLNRIVVNLGVNKAWLVNGEGEPFATRSEDKRSEAVVRRGAPVYDIDVTAGPAELSRMFTDERIIGYLDIPMLDSNYPLVRVSGPSMMPRLNHGSWVQIREVNVAGPISWGSIYVVVLEDYRMVKVIRRHPSDPSMVILHSYNPEFDDMEIDRADIKKLFHVTSIFNYDIIA